MMVAQVALKEVQLCKVGVTNIGPALHEHRQASYYLLNIQLNEQENDTQTL